MGAVRDHFEVVPDQHTAAIYEALNALGVASAVVIMGGDPDQIDLMVRFFQSAIESELTDLARGENP